MGVVLARIAGHADDLAPVRPGDFFSREPEAIVCTLTSVRGSSPREQGTSCSWARQSFSEPLRRCAGVHGHRACPPADRQWPGRRSHGRAAGARDRQCCGGRVEFKLAHADAALRERLAAQIVAEDAALPHVYGSGAGHVGRALAQFLSLLPVQLEVIDTRREELALLSEGITTRAVAMPRPWYVQPPQGSSYVILTHDHALDFMIAREALARSDAPYIGMVGSQTKRAKFSSWFKGEGGTLGRCNGSFCRSGRHALGISGPSDRGTGGSRIMVHIGKREAEIAQARAPRSLGCDWTLACHIGWN